MREVPVITVYPTKDSALLLVHPTHGPITKDGATWASDVFTARRIADGSVTTEAPKARTVKPDDAKADVKVEAPKVEVSKTDTK